MVTSKDLAILGIITYLGGSYCSTNDPVMLCWLDDFEDVHLPSSTCTHVLFGSYEIMGTLLASLTVPNRAIPPGLISFKAEHPNVKLIPYIESGYFESCIGRFELSTIKLFNQPGDPIKVDGLAVSVSALAECDEKTILERLKNIKEGSRHLPLIAHFPPGGTPLPSNHDSLWKKSEFVDLISYDHSWGRSSDSLAKIVKRSKIVYPLNLKATIRGKITGQENVQRILHQEAKSAVYQEYGGVSVVLSKELNSSEAYRNTYPFLSAVGDGLFPSDPTSIFRGYYDQEKEDFFETISYCKWGNNTTMANPIAIDYDKLIGCSFIGFEPAGEEDLSTLRKLAELPKAIPIKPVLILNSKSILDRHFNATGFVNQMRIYKIEGLDILTDPWAENDLSELTEAIKSIKSYRGITLFLSVSDPFSIISASKNRELVKAVDYMNINFFNKSTANIDPTRQVISAAPLTSFSGPENIVIYVNLATQYGVPEQKILLGLPNFAFRYTPGDISTLHKISFKEVCELRKNGTFIEDWDSVSATPYLHLNDSFVTYENSTSIQKKLDFATKLGLGGVSVSWIDYDECDGISNDGKTLSKQVKEYIFSKNNQAWVCRRENK